MTADLLREAAALMRQRAHAALECDAAPWLALESPEQGAWQVNAAPSDGWSVGAGMADVSAQHIASWHPAVALAVADWLEATAVRIDMGRSHLEGGRSNHGWRGTADALSVARAYLGRDS